MKCRYCEGNCYKKGFQGNGNQRFQCRSCKKYQQASYMYKAYGRDINKLIVKCVTNSVGIRGTSRIAEIAVNTVMKKIKDIASGIKPPATFAPLQSYEVDEMWTYIGNKRRECWIMYAIHRQSREPVALQVGSRNRVNLHKLVSSLLINYPKKIFTDRLKLYLKLIPAAMHGVKYRCTNFIERKNLTLRTLLKRLNRKTICYSRSRVMLESCLKIFFWYKSIP